MKKLLVALVLVAVLFGCSGGNKPADVTKKGSYQSAADDKGSYDVVELTLVNDKITEVKIDTFYGPKGEFKSVLKDDYGMRVASEIGKEWYEQAIALQDWMVGKTVDEVLAMKTYAKNDAHPVVPDEEDLKSTCTMNVGSYLEGVKAAAEAAVEVK